MAALAAVLANLVDNLPATLLLLPAVAEFLRLGAITVPAALVAATAGLWLALRLQGEAMNRMKVLIWIVEGTWEGCVDAAPAVLPADAEVVLFHVTAGEAAATQLLGAAATRLGPAIGSWSTTRPAPSP